MILITLFIIFNFIYFLQIAFAVIGLSLDEIETKKEFLLLFIPIVPYIKWFKNKFNDLE